MYRLNTIAQSHVANRLGYKFIFDPKHPSMHFRLDTSNPEHLDVANKLMDIATKDRMVQSCHNVFLNGKLLITKLVEDHSLWKMLTKDTPTPLLEWDFFGPDVWTQVLAAKPKTVEEQNAALDVLARRAMLDRCVKLHPYWVESRGWSGGPRRELKEYYLQDPQELGSEPSQESLGKAKKVPRAELHLVLSVCPLPFGPVLCNINGFRAEERV
jgi:hypothetical protein